MHLAITGLLEHEPDMVIAGINHGANLGDDVLYSGTVAAAVEGRFLGLPAIAVSLTGEHRYFDTAGQAIRTLFQTLVADVTARRHDPECQRSGYSLRRAARLPGHAARLPPPLGSPWWRPAIRKVGGSTGSAPPARGRTPGPGTDFHAVEHGFVSVTPLKLDLTDQSRLDLIAGWLPK